MKSPEQMIDDYLRQVEGHLPRISRPQRREFVAEVRSHLEEQVVSMESPSTADVLNVLERFGDPSEIARDFADGISGGEAGERGHSYPPTWLVLALTVIVWPVGVVLAWLSPAWTTRDKAVATLIPLLGWGLLLVGGLGMFVAGTTVVIEHSIPLDVAPWQDIDPAVRERGPSNAAILGIVIMPMLVGSPIISGIILAVRRRPGY